MWCIAHVNTYAHTYIHTRTSWKLSLFKHIYYYDTYIISCAYVRVAYIRMCTLCVCVCVCARVCACVPSLRKWLLHDRGSGLHGEAVAKHRLYCSGCLQGQAWMGGGTSQQEHHKRTLISSTNICPSTSVLSFPPLPSPPLPPPSLSSTHSRALLFKHVAVSLPESE